MIQTPTCQQQAKDSHHIYTVRELRESREVWSVYDDEWTQEQFPSACISLDGTYFLGYDKLHSEDVWIVTIELKCVRHQVGEK